MSVCILTDARVAPCARSRSGVGRHCLALAATLLALSLAAATAAAAQDGRKVIRFGAGGITGATCGPDRTAQPDCTPRAKGFAIPYYTMASLPPGVDVVVRVAFDITAEGTIANLVLDHDGMPAEVERVLRAEVSQWLYTPGRRGGEDAAFPGQSLKFTLRSGSGRPQPTDQVSARD